MSLTRQQWDMHKEAIQWFYEQQEGTEIWYRWKDGKEWKLTDIPSWSTDFIYILNDEYAEIRKAIADGKEI